MQKILEAFVVPACVLAVGIMMMIVEFAKPGRQWPKVAGWYARAIALNSVQVGVIVLAGLTWDGWLKTHRPWNADSLGVTGGAAAGYVATTFVYYWWHRARHASDFLWRWFHQVHHSPQRLEVITSFYKHPVELITNGLLSSVILYGLVGLGPVAAGYAMLLSGLAELIYHWNVRTPAWVGYLFQRPESHCLHHQMGLHAYNYGDLPIWDMLFGTFKNPPVFKARCGFADDRELHLGAMLVGTDVNEVPKGGAS